MRERARGGSRETVVLVHGLWMMGPDLTLLRRRLRRCGFQVRIFRYPTVRDGIDASAARLHRFLDTLPAGPVHLVAHSLGGLLVRRLLERWPQSCRGGRIVTLGTPHRGSRAARHLARWRWGGWLMGRNRQLLERGLGPWRGGIELGSVAGTRAVGAGRLVGTPLPLPNDGTVALDETRLEGVADEVALPVTHFGLLFSPAVARQTCHFLCHGRFEHGGAGR